MKSGPTAGERADLQLVRKKKRITNRKSGSLVKSWKDVEQEQAAS